MDGFADGAANMAADLYWLETAERSATPLTVLRIYGWRPATVSIGRHQEAHRAFGWRHCRSHGIPWVRRPSGGRAVFHADELTYAVISNDNTLFGSGVTAAYERVAEWLRDGLLRAGVPVIVAGRHAAAAPSPRGPRPGPCFLATSRGALVAGHRKVAGSAQYRRGGSFLQHGSIPLRVDYEAMGAVLGVTPERLRRAIVPIEEIAGSPVSWEQLAESLREAFAGQFGCPQNADDGGAAVSGALIAES